ncbi:CDP-glycerol glycerophosphotransferase family protein [Lactiplantibacillus plantarum]|uniref:CDP-glycerol glycerophosphotransferase family protein n=1 Tax=Lactiplantibacillus plantarum TaxID=1590 RepID=UPI003F86BCC6
MRKLILICVQNVLSPFLTILNRLMPKNNSRIVLYSNLGFRDNIEALYSFLIQNGYNENYELVCVSNDFYDKGKFNYKNVKICSPIIGLWFFLTSKYFFYCFGKYPIYPSEKQKVVNLFHGMPIKKIGNMQLQNSNIKYDYFTYTIAYSAFFLPYIEKSFGVDARKVLLTGSPRLDIMMNARRVKKIDAQKIVVWMPTYRDDDSNPLTIDEEFNLNKLNDLLNIINILLIIKPHPLDKFSNKNYSNLSNIKYVNDRNLMDRGIELYDLLGKSDALITDYSSVSIDYLLTDRPMAYVLVDQNGYAENRGFNFSIDEVVAGKIILSTNDFIRFLSDLANGKDEMKEQRSKVRNKIFDLKHTENNSERILKFVGIQNE